MDLNEAFQVLTKNGYVTISDEVELTNTEINKASKEYAEYRKSASQKLAAKLADKGEEVYVDDDTGEYMAFTDPAVAFRAGVKWALKRINKKV